ncbi:hypothetical protein IL306_014977 [Fusarium sp. DS 682]|nr:hypothetical protein IL306_014977 [Fusarium sp. DS 682]
MATSNTPSSQYHHFVPQFLLKNFAHPFIPSKGGSSTSTNPPNGKSGKGTRSGDLVVNCLDLSSETPEIMEAPVKRILGQTDMYRDSTKPSPEQHLIEEMLSRLESDASAVFRNITKSFENRHSGIWLTRNERNLIRKFLFLMKYRGSTFHQRFYHQVATDYGANDRDKLFKYMRKKSFERPIDVWLDNIRTIINLEMDDGLKWISELPQRMYPDDAMWVILHCQCMYMALCSPSYPDDEFILTDNSYHVFEGPSHVSTDANTGKFQELAWTSLHEFAPISPKLMIVLRSFILPSPLEDADPKVKATRDKWHSLAVERIFGNGTSSLLADLPISKARNNYTQVVNGRLQLIPHEDGSLRQNHKFFFRFFPIATADVNKINGIFLDNASVCKSVVFRSVDSFRRTLEWYMTEPCQIGKRVTRATGDRRLHCLMKLAAALKRMGSEKDPVWGEVPFPELDNDDKCRLMLKRLRELLPSLLQLLPDDDLTEFMQIYKALGELLSKNSSSFAKTQL